MAAKSDVLITSARFLRELAEGKAQDVLPLSDDPAFFNISSPGVKQEASLFNLRL